MAPRTSISTNVLLHRVITRFYSFKCSPVAWNILAHHAVLAFVFPMFTSSEACLEFQTCPLRKRSICGLLCAERLPRNQRLGTMYIQVCCRRSSPVDTWCLPRPQKLLAVIKKKSLRMPPSWKVRTGGDSVSQRDEKTPQQHTAISARLLVLASELW